MIQKIYKHLNILIVLISAFVLVSIWFKNGNIMGAGESGLPFYDFNIEYELQKTAWFKHALGGPTSVIIASTPSYFVLKNLQNLGIPAFLMQAAFFWICLVVSGISIYKLCKELFPEINERFLLLSVFFYWFNPISLVNVWNRFLNNYFLFFAFLPLSLYFFIRGIKTGSYNYCVIFVIISSFFSYVYSSMAFNILLWYTIFFAAIFYITVQKNIKHKIFVLVYFLTFFSLWVLTNLWWITQILGYISSPTFSAATQSFFTNAGNFEGFSTISEKLGRITDILAFRHSSFYMDSKLAWFEIYNLAFIKLLNLLISLVVLMGILLGRKRSGVVFLSLYSLVALFLIKGNNFPFGELISWLFINIPAYQLFRNPFEKFGFLLVLGFTPLFVYGAYSLTNLLKRNSLVYLTCALVIIIIWGFPFWTGLVFTTNFTPMNDPYVKYEVVVPPEYKQASKWLLSQPGDFKLIVLPLFEEGVTYNWEKGFNGIDLTNQVLPVQSVSFNTTVPFYYDVASDIQKVFLENDKFYPLMNALNAKYVLVREDINWQQRKMINPQKITEVLEKRALNGEFKKVATFGKLTFWENLHYKPSEIYSANNLAVISPKPLAGDITATDSASVYLSEQAGQYISGEESISKIYPEKRLIIIEFNQERYASQHIFPYVSTYPDSKKYPLVLIKEKIQKLFIADLRKKIDFELQLLGKRLKESDKEANDKNSKLLFASLEKYFEIIEDYKKLYKEYFSSVPQSQKEDVQLQQAEIFYKHILILSDLEKAYKENPQVVLRITSHITELKKILADLEIYPHNELFISESFPLKTRLIYQYQIQSEGEYKLLIKDQNILRNFQINNNQMFIQINERLESIVPQWTEGGFLYLGTHFLKKGENEISFNSFESKNLVKGSDFDMKATASEFVKRLPIDNLITDRKYDISFNYLIKKGNGPVVSLYNDNSIPLGNEKTPEALIEIRPDYYDFDKKYFGFSTGNLYGATSSDLVFILRPWKSCGNFLLPDQEWCKDNRRSISFDRQSEVEINNVLVTEQFTETPYLEKVESPAQQSKPPEIRYIKIDNTKYEIAVKNAGENFVLILSQLYDAGWSLKNQNGERVGQGPFLANVFSNGWIVNQPGSYRLILEYEPQNRLETTAKISAVILAALVFWLLWNKKESLFKK